MNASWSVVTVTFNSAETLRRLWQWDTPGCRWVVVDNASSDGSADVARNLGADVIELPKNVGFARANNIGLAAVDTRYVAFVNPDVRVDFASLDMLGEICTSRRALVAPQLIDLDGSLQPNGRGLPFLADKLAHRGFRLPGARLDSYLPRVGDGVTSVVWLMGAVVCAETEEFRTLGGWSERYFLYYEDHELGMRAGVRGTPVLVVPDVHWMHEWARATMSWSLVHWAHEVASAIRFYARYPDLLLPVRRIAMRRYGSGLLLQ